MTHFGKLIKTLRSRHRFRQIDLARLARMSLSAVQNMERAESNTLRWANFRAVAEAFRLSEDELDAMARGDVKQVPVNISLSVLTALEPWATARKQTVDDYIVILLEDHLASLRRESRKSVVAVVPPRKRRTRGHRGAGGAAA